MGVYGKSLTKRQIWHLIMLGKFSGFYGNRKFDFSMQLPRRKDAMKKRHIKHRLGL